jgi:hypothetical protein
MRCTYPHCYREAELRCANCRQRYCTRHCGDRVSDAGERTAECDLCDPVVAAEIAPAPSPLAGLADVGAVILFLAIVALGVAIDITAKGSGLIALWVFTGAFIALMAPRQR